MTETKNNPGVEFLFANVLNHANKKKRIQRLNFVSIYSETVDEKWEYIFQVGLANATKIGIKQTVSKQVHPTNKREYFKMKVSLHSDKYLIFNK